MVAHVTHGVAFDGLTLSGTQIVAVRVAPSGVPKTHALIDLVLIHVGGGSIVNLTHNWVRKGSDGSGVSLEPSLSGNLLMFKQAPSPYGRG